MIRVFLAAIGFRHAGSCASPGKRKIMTDHLQYGTTAKVFHWLVLALLLVQYPLGWLMPDIHRGMKPGADMSFHVSLGIIILLAAIVRLLWRRTHTAVTANSLPPWQRLTAQATHWLLYVLVLATTITGWLFASFRGWAVSFFYLFPTPMLASENRAGGEGID